MIKEVGTAIWELSSGQAGKTITILGGTHGNERTGIEVVRTLKEMADHEEINLNKGTLIFALGNVKAIEQNERGSSAKDDLNRSFPPNILERENFGTYEETRARELAPFLIRSDIVIDLHATNKPSEPFLACLDSDQHREIYQWFTCEKVLADPQYLLGGSPVTTDEFTEAHGGIGICYETGESSDTSRVDEVVTDILNLLKSVEVIVGKPNATVKEKVVYEITYAIKLTEEGFVYAGDLGSSSWQEYKKRDVIGTHGSKELIAKEDGVIVFPKLEKHWVVGRPVGYLAKRVK